MSKKVKKLFVIRKYINASCAAEALQKERKFKADECWLDDDYKKTLSSAIGFEVRHDEEER